MRNCDVQGQYRSRELKWQTIMLACKHDSAEFGSPMCEHLRIAQERAIPYVKWYIESGLKAELLCMTCAEKRTQGLVVDVANVCEQCFEQITTEIGYLKSIGGKPEIRVRPEPFNPTLKTTSLPKQLGAALDIAPVNDNSQSVWMILAANGDIFKFNADTGHYEQVTRSSVPVEPGHEDWPKTLRQRLHVSHRGEFVAVVNDYGRYGQIINVRTGKVTLELDGGDYHEYTVPLSFAFADVSTGVIAIHRTDWNRLDFSNPANGSLLSERSPTSYQSHEKRPDHYLDYFHGALYVNPSCTRIMDDGWIWHPVGVPRSWSLERWFSENVWESEDGSSRKEICAREYYWDRSICWLDDSRVVISGIGDDDAAMVDGARIFDVTASGSAGPQWRSDLDWALEVSAFAGPAGRFFSDGISLFSSNKEGLSRWSIDDGALTGQLKDFEPTHHHRGARELVQLSDNVLTRFVIYCPQN